VDNGIVLLGILRLDGRLGGLALGHDRAWEELGQVLLNSWSSVDAINLSVVSQLSLSQSKACLTSPLMEMTPRSPSIFNTK
jgi:hypothetical protein